MIGMSQIKKKTIQGIIIGVAIGVVGIGLTLWWAIATIKTYEKGTNTKFNNEYTKLVTVLNKDVIQGEVITDDMVTTVRVHKNTVPTGAVESPDAVKGKVAKYNIAASVPLTESMIADEIISADVRNQEVNTVLLPSDLKENEYVDIRIMYPNGTDYIVLAQKQVEKLSDQAMWINLGEDERLLLNSAIVDSFLTTGTKLYATRYADSNAQIKVASDIDASMAKEDDESEEGDGNDTTNATTSNDENESNFTLKEKAISIAKGSLKEKIKDDIAEIKAADDDNIVDYIFNMILEYKNFASAVTRTTENYQPNNQVMNMMKTNGNILQQAKDKLSAEARANIENGINNYKSDTGDDYNNVVAGAQESIANQKALRNEMLAPVVDTSTENTTDTTSTNTEEQ